MSVDDLFVLNRFLPTTGELLHYLTVRQHVAGLPKALLFDEIDHLGAYVSRNRFDVDLREQLTQADHVTWDSFSDKIDRHFEREDWATRPVPAQQFPAGLARLLSSLDLYRPSGWLRIDAHLRDFDEVGRQNIAGFMDELEPTLHDYPRRRFSIANDNPLQIWLCRTGAEPDKDELRFQGQIACAVAKTTSADIVVLSYTQPSEISSVRVAFVKAASMLQLDYADIQIEAARQLESAMTSKQAIDARKRKQPRRSGKPS